MPHAPQIKIPATYIRGGTSKGVFFRLQDLPAACQVPGEARDKLFMRVIGSPDRFGKHIDGMGSATSSTSKVVLLSRSLRPGPGTATGSRQAMAASSPLGTPVSSARWPASL